MENGDKMKKITGFIIVTLCLFGCSTDKELSRYQSNMTNLGFDTFISFIGYSEDEETFQALAEQAKQEFIRYNQLFDKYNTYESVANIKTINDAAGEHKVIVDQEIIDVLLLSKQYGSLSNNQYDVTMGSVLSIWHDYREDAKLQEELGEEGKLPSQSELDEAKTCTGWENIEIDETENSVYINKACASLDVGSVAKGYATEKVAQTLREKGLTAGIINAGGNVRIIGNKPDGKPWGIGVQSPDLQNIEGASLVNIESYDDYSYVTSGDYQRCYIVDGIMYHHIIDPHTLQPARYSHSVTIRAKDSGIADILSTTLFTMSYEEGTAYLATLREQGIEADAIWVFDEDTPLPNIDEVTYLEKGNYKIVISDALKEQVSIAK